MAITTGQYYYGARYYDPKVSKWMSSDPAGFQLVNPMDSEGKPRANFSITEATNWYSYTSNNPVMYVDPTGMDDEDPVVLSIPEEIPQNMPVWPLEQTPQDAGTSSDFGWRPDPFGEDSEELHNGMDMPAENGTAVLAILDGEVVESGFNPKTWGNYMRVRHENGDESFYAHMEDLPKFGQGELVTKGTIIGTVGDTGRSTGSHLHFGYKKSGEWVNPAETIFAMGPAFLTRKED